MTPVNGDFDLMLRDALHAEVDSLEPAAGGLERIRQRTRAPWLVRPVLAVTGAVVIVVAGVYGLAQVRDRIVLELFRGGSSVPASPGSGAGTGHEVPTLNDQSNPAIAPSGAGTTSTTPSAKPTCS